MKSDKQIILEALEQAFQSEEDTVRAQEISHVQQAVSTGTADMTDPEPTNVKGQVAILFDFNLELEGEELSHFNEDRWGWLNDVLGDYLRGMIPADNEHLKWFKPSPQGNHEAWIANEKGLLVQLSGQPKGE